MNTNVQKILSKMAFYENFLGIILYKDKQKEEKQLKVLNLQKEQQPLLAESTFLI